MRWANTVEERENKPVRIDDPQSPKEKAKVLGSCN